MKAESTLKEFEAIRLSVVACRVVGIEFLPSLGDDALSTTLRSSDGQTITVLVLKAESALLRTAPHVIREDAFSESMKYLQELHQLFNGIVSTDRERLTKETRICQVFALDTASGEPLNGECYEGFVYDVNEDALEHPYQVVLGGRRDA